MAITKPSIGPSPANSVGTTLVVEKDSDAAVARSASKASNTALNNPLNDSARNQTLRTLVLSATLDGLQSGVDSAGDRQDQIDQIDSAIAAAQSELLERREQLATSVPGVGASNIAPDRNDYPKTSKRNDLSSIADESRDAVSAASDPSIRALAIDPDVVNFLNQDIDIDSIEGIDTALGSSVRARSAVTETARKTDPEPQNSDDSFRALSQVLNIPSQDAIQSGDTKRVQEIAQETASALSRLSLPLTVGVESQLRGY